MRDDDWSLTGRCTVPYCGCDTHCVAQKMVENERERCAKMVEELRATWFHDGIPGDLAVPAGAFARSMKELAVVMRDPNVSHVKTE